MKKLIGGGIVAAVAIFAGAGAFEDLTTRNEQGEVVEGGGLGVFVMQVGDCINAPDEDLVQSVEAVPCSESHDGELYALFDMAPVSASYPGEDAVHEAATEGCYARFGGYVGAAYEYSELDFSYFYPTEDSWNGEDDREIACVLISMDGSTLTGSMRGSAR